jgi:hypothetical protein
MTKSNLIIKKKLKKFLKINLVNKGLSLLNLEIKFSLNKNKKNNCSKIRKKL